MKNLGLVLTSGIIVGLSIYFLLAVCLASKTNSSPMKSTDTAIILGARIKKNGQYNSCLLSRVDEGVKLFNEKKVKQIIVSGGDDREDGLNEAVEMKKLLIAKQIPGDSILIENTSTSTYENLRNTKKLMAEKNLSTATVVTEPFHIGRAELIAKSLAMNAEFDASENSPCWEKGTYLSRYFLKEPVAALSYLLTGKITVNSFFK